MAVVVHEKSAFHKGPAPRGQNLSTPKLIIQFLLSLLFLHVTCMLIDISTCIVGIFQIVSALLRCVKKLFTGNLNQAIKG